MAVIPHGENLGYAVPRAQQAVQVPAGAFGENVGREVQQAAGNEAERLMVERRRQEAEERQRQKEAEAARKAAEKARSTAILTAAQDDLQVLHDDVAEGVKTGRIPKDKATEEWQRQAKERSEATLQAIPEEYRELAGYSLTHKTAQLERGVRRAITARDQTDTLAGINDTLEAAQRTYMRDPKGSQALVDKTLAELGPAAGLTTEQIRAKAQTWKESTRFTLATSMVTAARRDNRALDAVAQRLSGAEFADMDPQRKVTLLSQIEGFRASNITAAEAAARRAEAQAERRLREAEAEFSAASTLINGGKMLNPEAVERLTARTAGTPFAAAVPELLKAAPERAGLGAQPVAVMDAAINELRAQLNVRGTDPKTEKRIKELETIRDAAKRDYKEDALPAALERGVIDRIAPLDTSNMATMTAGLAARVEQAQVVSTRTGEPVSPLLRTEADQVSRLIAALPVDQRATAIAELAQAAGPGFASAIGRQIAPKDKALGLALGMAGAKTTQGRYTSELILRGAQAVKDRSINLENQSVVGIRSQVATEIGDAYTNDEVRQAMIEASIYAYYGLQAEGSADMSRAVRLATGGIVERAGKKLPLPYGMAEEEFDRKLRAVTAADLKLPDGKVYVDGKPMEAAEFVKQVPAAVLVHAGQGRYAVRAGNSLAKRKDGRPVTLEVR